MIVPRHNGAALLAVSISADSPIGKDIKSAFGRDYLCINFLLSNAGGSAPLTINASDISVTMKDGTTHAALPPQNLFAAAPADGPRLRFDYPATATVEVGSAKQASVTAFWPADIDPARIDQIIVQIDGTPVTVASKFMNVDEKSAVFVPAKSE